MAGFLDTKLDEEELESLEDHLRIENFRKNSSVNYDILKELGILVQGEQGFVRNGKTDGWKEYFKGELNDRANKWIADNLKNTDIRFPE